MARLLLAGGAVLAGRPPQVIESGAVLVEDGQIARVGTSEELRSTPADRVIDTTGGIVVPGLVNTHQHHWYLLAKGLGDGLILERWIREFLFPLGRALEIDDLRLASEISCLDMIRGGTTTALNHMVTETTPEQEQAVLAPAAGSGMRQFFAKATRPAAVEDDFHALRRTFDQWDGEGHGRVRVGLALEASAHWVAAGASTQELLEGGHTLATELDTFVTSHIAAGTLSRDDGYLKWVLETGRTDLEYLHALGVLDHRWTLAHTIHPRDRDLDLIAASGATVSHTPSSEAARGGGITPVKRMVDAGVQVAIGTDGPMVDATNDMLEQLKWTRLLQNQLHQDAAALSLEQVMQMGTHNGARALGAGDRFGAIEPGYAADLAVFDLRTLHVTVAHRPLSAFVNAARSPDARYVMADGRLLLDDGVLVGADQFQLTEMLHDAGDRGRALARRAGLLPPE